MGGSFNPAHGGHRHLSLLALKYLDLDEVWWLVSPQNPLKPRAGMAPFLVRLARARRIARHPRIRVSDLERRLGTLYTADTLAALQRRLPRLDFIWLMGADNLAQLRHWERWDRIFRTVPIAVFDRPSHSLRALAGLPARRFARYRAPHGDVRRLAAKMPPAWAFFHTRLDPRSASEVRDARKRRPSLSAKEQRPELSTNLAVRRAVAQPQSHLLPLILGTLEDGKAEDIVTVELAGKSTIADQMVIASGRSGRQIVALTERLEAALPKRIRVAIEGKQQADWVLIDAGDVIIHLFRPEVRARYNLEKMWGGPWAETEAALQ